VTQSHTAVAPAYHMPSRTAPRPPNNDSYTHNLLDYDKPRGAWGYVGIGMWPPSHQ
jgi:hypothetical protein